MQGILKQSWILDSMLWIPDFLSVELGLWTPIASGILDSFSCNADSKVQDSKAKFA